MRAHTLSSAVINGTDDVTPVDAFAVVVVVVVMGGVLSVGTSCQDSGGRSSPPSRTISGPGDEEPSWDVSPRDGRWQ